MIAQVTECQIKGSPLKRPVGLSLAVCVPDHGGFRLCGRVLMEDDWRACSTGREIILPSRLPKTLSSFGARGKRQLRHQKGRRVLSQPDDDLVAYPSRVSGTQLSPNQLCILLHGLSQEYIYIGGSFQSCDDDWLHDAVTIRGGRNESRTM